MMGAVGYVQNVTSNLLSPRHNRLLEFTPGFRISVGQTLRFLFYVPQDDNNISENIPIMDSFMGVSVYTYVGTVGDEVHTERTQSEEILSVIQAQTLGTRSEPQ